MSRALKKSSNSGINGAYTILFFHHTMPMTTKLGRIMIYLDGLYLQYYMILQSGGLVSSCDKLKTFNLYFTRTIVTKYGKAVNYHEELPPIKSHIPLNTSSREAT